MSNTISNMNDNLQVKRFLEKRIMIQTTRLFCKYTWISTIITGTMNEFNLVKLNGRLNKDLQQMKIDLATQ